MDIINILTWILLFIVALLTVLHFYISRRYGTLEALGIPCERPLPFFGNSFQEFNTYIHVNDIRLYKKHGRIHGHYETRHPTIRIGDPEILREVLVKQFSNFADRRHFEGFVDPVLNKFISLMTGEEWRQKRNLLTPAFTSGKLRQMIPLIEKCSGPLLTTIEEKSETKESFDAKQVFTLYLIDVIASCAFGLDMNTKPKDGKTFIKHAKQLMAGQSLTIFLLMMAIPPFIMNWLSFLMMKSFKGGLEFFKKVSYDIIKIRQTTNQRRDDFLQILLDSVKEGDEEIDFTKNKDDSPGSNETNGHYKPPLKKILTVDDVAANTLLFLFAGFETTSTTLSFVAYSIATNPECQDRLIEEIDRVLEKNEGRINHDVVAQMQYMEMVIMETLRYYPPLLRIDRHCVATSKINNLTIPKDTIIVIPVYAIHHDEEYYPEPYKFDPERFSPENKDQRNQYTFFGFGIGPRNCIGMRFALMEVKLVLTYILKSYRLTCGPKTQVPLKFIKNRVMLAPEDGIQLYVEKRSKAESD